MVWRLIAKIARFYAFIAFCVLGLMLASDKISSHQPSASESLLALFFPYGVLVGLVGLAISLIFMRPGGWITLLSVAGFYLGSGPIIPACQLSQIAGTPPKQKELE